LERAIDHARKGGDESREGLLEGVELVLRELHSVLSKHGVTPIEAQGQLFDPALHEAMAQVPDASVPANTVVQVFQPGYQLRGRLLRPARVLVSKPPEGAAGSAREGGGTGPGAQRGGPGSEGARAGWAGPSEPTPARPPRRRP